MIVKSLFGSESTCEVCGKSGSVSEIDTYMSSWKYCADCGCYSRNQKLTYPLEWISSNLLLLFQYVPKLNGFLRSLGRKKQGVDFYRYYLEQLASGLRGPWAGQSDMVAAELRSADLLQCVSRCKVLEISGEPGFFAYDLMHSGADIIVSAFADDVAGAMASHLHLKTFTYDFNVDDIANKVEANGAGGNFDWIFIRFAIGFCQDVPTLMQKLGSMLKSDGKIYISFSPASRVVLLRWMFDDYTYLRQYTESFLIDTAKAAGMSLSARFDERPFHWDKGQESLHWSLRPIARRYFNNNPFFRAGDENDAIQRRVALVFCKK